MEQYIISMLPCMIYGYRLHVHIHWSLPVYYNQPYHTPWNIYSRFMVIIRHPQCTCPEGMKNSMVAHIIEAPA